MLKEALNNLKPVACCDLKCVNQWNWRELHNAQQVILSLVSNHFQHEDMSMSDFLDFLQDMMHEEHK
jgi:hypothetical protein